MLNDPSRNQKPSFVICNVNCLINKLSQSSNCYFFLLFWVFLSDSDSLNFENRVLVSMFHHTKCISSILNTDKNTLEIHAKNVINIVTLSPTNNYCENWMHSKQKGNVRLKLFWKDEVVAFHQSPSLYKDYSKKNNLLY